MASNTSRVLPVLRSRNPCAAGLMGMLAVLLVTLAGCERSVLDPAGPVSKAEVVIMLDALAIMLAIVVPVILARSPSPGGTEPRIDRRYPPHGHTQAPRTLVWSIPALSFFFSAASPGSDRMTLIPRNP